MSRRADRKPETAKDKRFFDLRESGYSGHIDQEGRKVEDVDKWIDKHVTRPKR
ncbi:MAG: hypothetical protein ACRDRL_02675 [Sciscionella sp.]